MRNNKELDASDYSFGHLTIIPSLHYLVKCRSHSLAIYNNEFILGSACTSSEMINWIATNSIGNYCLPKSHVSCYIHHYYCMCSNVFLLHERKR